MSMEDLSDRCKQLERERDLWRGRYVEAVARLDRDAVKLALLSKITADSLTQPYSTRMPELDDLPPAAA